MPAKPSLLIVLSRFPYPLEKGDKLRAYHQIKYLAKHFDIYLFCTNAAQVAAPHFDKVNRYCQAINIVTLSLPMAVWRIAKALFSNTALQYSFYNCNKARKALHAFTQQHKPQILYTQLARTAGLVQGLQLPWVMDLQDAFSVNYTRSAAQGPWYKQWLYALEARRILKLEQYLLQHCQACTIISDTDNRYLNNKCTVINNGVDADYFNKEALAESINQKYDIVFVGNLGYQPNVLAAQYIAEQIVPLIIAQGYNIKVLIAGASPNAKVKQLANANISIQAWLPDIRLAYAQARVFVAPIFTGAGMQNKILEALCMQLPCIITPTVQAPFGEGILPFVHIADTPTQFAQAVITALKNTTPPTLARNYISSHYSWTSQANKLQQLLSSYINTAS
jgi:polysaccharide biosynthesis protein PslH